MLDSSHISLTQSVIVRDLHMTKCGVFFGVVFHGNWKCFRISKS